MSEARVVQMRFVEKKSLDETAKALGISRVEVRKIESAYMAKKRKK